MIKPIPDQAQAVGWAGFLPMRFGLRYIDSMGKNLPILPVLSKTYWAQNREMMLKVLTHNIAIILLVNEHFYRACPILFLMSCA